MARFVTPMSTAGQHLRARLWADVIVVDATLLITLVLGAASHPRATLLASSVVSPALQQFALDLLIHVTAAAFDDGGFVTRWTHAQVAPGGTNMV